jgi:hypothetical protein
VQGRNESPPATGKPTTIEGYHSPASRTSEVPRQPPSSWCAAPNRSTCRNPRARRGIERDAPDVLESLARPVPAVLLLDQLDLNRAPCAMAPARGPGGDVRTPASHDTARPTPPFLGIDVQIIARCWSRARSWPATCGPPPPVRGWRQRNWVLSGHSAGSGSVISGPRLISMPRRVLVVLVTCRRRSRRGRRHARPAGPLAGRRRHPRPDGRPRVGDHRGRQRCRSRPDHLGKRRHPVHRTDLPVPAGPRKVASERGSDSLTVGFPQLRAPQRPRQLPDSRRSTAFRANGVKPG